jgi:hypothetical protein
VILSDPGAIAADACTAVPVRFWQAWQWQYAAPTSGSEISKRIAPQPQLPRSGEDDIAISLPTRIPTAPRDGERLGALNL